MQNSAFEHQCSGVWKNIDTHQAQIARLLETVTRLQAECEQRGHKPAQVAGAGEGPMPVACVICRKILNVAAT